MGTRFQPGDLVWVVPDASHIVRNERITTKAIVIREIPGDWYRVHMSWPGATKIIDLPLNMLKKIDSPPKP